jgi:hypothetical protein
MCQPLIPTGEQSGLPTHIAGTESGSWCERMKKLTGSVLISRLFNEDCAESFTVESQPEAKLLCKFRDMFLPICFIYRPEPQQVILVNGAVRIFASLQLAFNESRQRFRRYADLGRMAMPLSMLIFTSFAGNGAIQSAHLFVKLRFQIRTLPADCVCRSRNGD